MILSALLCNFVTANPALDAGSELPPSWHRKAQIEQGRPGRPRRGASGPKNRPKRNARFARRNEPFRTPSHKPLKLLQATNQ
jgi:hypothetical protein